MIHTMPARSQSSKECRGWDEEKIARPVNGSSGTIGVVEITEEVISRLVKNAEDGFPGAAFRMPGRPARTKGTRVP